MAFTPITVVGTFEDASGKPANGRVTATPSHVFTNGEDAVTTKPIIGKITNGALSFKLMASNDPATIPIEAYYTFRLETFTGGVPTVFKAVVPYEAEGGTIDFTTLAQSAREFAVSGSTTEPPPGPRGPTGPEGREGPPGPEGKEGSSGSGSITHVHHGEEALPNHGFYQAAPTPDSTTIVLAKTSLVLIWARVIAENSSEISVRLDHNAAGFRNEKGEIIERASGNNPPGNVTVYWLAPSPRTIIWENDFHSLEELAFDTALGSAFAVQLPPGSHGISLSYLTPSGTNLLIERDLWVHVL